MTPGPATYSSSYGSPPTIMPTRQSAGRNSHNLDGALRAVMDTFNADSQNGSRIRAGQGTDRQRRIEPEEVAGLEREAISREQAEEEDEDEDDDDDNDDADEGEEEVDLVPTGDPRDDIRPTPARARRLAPGERVFRTVPHLTVR